MMRIRLFSSRQIRIHLSLWCRSVSGSVYMRTRIRLCFDADPDSALFSCGSAFMHIQLCFSADLDPALILSGSGSFSSARIYRPSFENENDRFGEKQLKTIVFNPIRTQRRWYQLVSDEIRLGASFQILELRRVRDQHVFLPNERPYKMACFYKICRVCKSWK